MGKVATEFPQNLPLLLGIDLSKLLDPLADDLRLIGRQAGQNAFAPLFVKTGNQDGDLAERIVSGCIESSSFTFSLHLLSNYVISQPPNRGLPVRCQSAHHEGFSPS